MTSTLLILPGLLISFIVLFTISVVNCLPAYKRLEIDDFVLVFDREGWPIETYVLAKEDDRICLYDLGWVSKRDFVFGNSDGTDYMFN